MGRWQPLPQGLGPEERRLVERLRLLKDRTGLSLASLAAKTAYSKSSWQRYLSGGKLPPWEAVDAFGRLAGENRARLRVTWELAVSAGNPGAAANPADPANGMNGAKEANGGGARGAAVPAPAAEAGDPAVRRRPAGAALALAAALLLLAVPGSQREVGGRPEWPWALARAHAADPACRGSGCYGVDPHRSRCDRDESELARTEALAHRVRLMFSPRCQAVWGEVRPVPGTSELTISTVDSGLLSEARGARRTRMINAADPAGAQVCVDVGRDAHMICAKPEP